MEAAVASSLSLSSRRWITGVIYGGVCRRAPFIVKPVDKVFSSRLLLSANQFDVMRGGLMGGSCLSIF